MKRIKVMTTITKRGELWSTTYVGSPLFSECYSITESELPEDCKARQTAKKQRLKLREWYNGHDYQELAQIVKQP